MPRLTILLHSLALLLIGTSWFDLSAQPLIQSDLCWIWTPEARDQKNLPEGTRWFRKTFTIDRDIANPVDDAILEMTADNQFTVWFNGHEVGSGAQWNRIHRFDVKKHAIHGKNIIAVAATNDGDSPAGLLVRLTATPNGKTKQATYSDGSWKVSLTEPRAGWTGRDFDDKNWPSAFSLGVYGPTKPWGNIQWEDAPTSNRFKVPAGFIVDTVIPPNPVSEHLSKRLPFSLVNMTFDAKGRLLVSQELGPILLCTPATGEKKGEYSIKPYCKQIKNAHGMCWVRDALLVVGDGPKGTGLYRTRDTNGDDETDEAQLLHKFKGGMGEHGPHAIIHGPDDWLYLVIGNHAWAQPGKLAANSPLLRWPTGHFGPDQGKPNTTEDVLLPRLNDGRGHAANILAPGGTIWRLDHEGNNMSLVAAGFRNHFDAAFRSDGELFTFDSDMEWDLELPWYRPVRVCHCPPGADYVWRTGAANTPNYYLDSLPPLAETGRGSPVGVAFYEHDKFPAKYQGAFFLGDWSMGIIFAVHLKPQGASFKAEVEQFCVGTPLNVTDLETGPDGSLYFTLGGRGTAGGVYRIRYEGQPDQSAKGKNQPLAAWSPGRTAWKDPHASPPSLESCLTDLKTDDPLKQRLACEAIIRFGYDVPRGSIWSLLGSPDQFVRTAARLVLQRIDPFKWADQITRGDDLRAMEAVVALCKIHRAKDYTMAIYERLNKLSHPSTPEVQLQQLRTWQLAFIHAPIDGHENLVASMAKQWLEQFPTSDWRVNRELAILLAHTRRSGWTELPVLEKLLGELSASSANRQQAIHYFYCLRLLHQGWNAQLKQAMLAWYENTKTWSGGHSFAPFMENIFKDWTKALSSEDRLQALEQADQMPHVATVLLRLEDSLSPNKLTSLYGKLAQQKDESSKNAREAIFEQLGRTIQSPVTQSAVRQLAESYPDQAETAARILAKAPTLENVPFLLRGLASTSPVVLKDCVQALLATGYRPKIEEAAPYRAVIIAVNRLDARNRPLALKLLQSWKAQRFTPDEGDLQKELEGWSRWFIQAFPKERPLPNVSTLTAISKWKMAELRAFLEQDPKGKSGNIAQGKLIFTKANCHKCHKFGSEGEGIGPDLTTLKSRFQRVDMLEALIDPSKTISDQYRGSVIVTTSGQTITGLAAPQGDIITILQIDGTKVTIKKTDVESQIASTVSPMPEKLLDELTLQEIADLFAYLESNPK